MGVWVFFLLNYLISSLFRIFVWLVNHHNCKKESQQVVINTRKQWELLLVGKLLFGSWCSYQEVVDAILWKMAGYLFLDSRSTFLLSSEEFIIKFTQGSPSLKKDLVRTSWNFAQQTSSLSVILLNKGCSVKCLTIQLCKSSTSVTVYKMPPSWRM